MASGLAKWLSVSGRLTLSSGWNLSRILQRIKFILSTRINRSVLYTLPGWTPDQLEEDDQPQTQEEASSSSVVPRSFSAEELVEIEVEVEEDIAGSIEVPVSSSSPTPSASSIPKATAEVPKYGRLIFVNPPPPPPRPSLSRPSEPKLRPTPKIRPAAPKIPPAAVLPPAPKVPEVAALPPAPKARSLPKPRPPPLQKARPAVPKEPNYPPPAAKEGPAEEHRDEADGYIDSALIGGGSLLISPVTNRHIRLRDSVRRAVQRVVLLDFHNTIDRVFMPGQRRPRSIALRIPTTGRLFYRTSSRGSSASFSRRRTTLEAALTSPFVHTLTIRRPTNLGFATVWSTASRTLVRSAIPSVVF